MKSTKMTYFSSIALMVIFSGCISYVYGVNAEMAGMQTFGGVAITVGCLPFLASTFRSVAKQEKARKLRRKQDKLDYLAKRAGK